MESHWRPSLQSCLLCWQRFQTKRSHQVPTWIGVKGARVTSWSKQKRFGLVVCRCVAQLCCIVVGRWMSESFCEHFEQLWGGDPFLGDVGTCVDKSAAITLTQGGYSDCLFETVKWGSNRILKFDLNAGKLFSNPHYSLTSTGNICKTHHKPSQTIATLTILHDSRLVDTDTWAASYVTRQFMAIPGKVRNDTHICRKISQQIGYHPSHP